MPQVIAVSAACGQGMMHAALQRRICAKRARDMFADGNKPRQAAHAACTTLRVPEHRITHQRARRLRHQRLGQSRSLERCNCNAPTKGLGQRATTLATKTLWCMQRTHAQHSTWQCPAGDGACSAHARLATRHARSAKREQQVFGQ